MLVGIPSDDLVVDYFRWRCEDANRNALNAWCYWKLRERGMSASDATKQLEGTSIAEKNEILFQFGINYDDLPAWQKRGVGLFYAEVDRTILNPMDNQEITVSRKQLTVEMELPRGTEHDALIKKRLAEQIP